MRDGAMDRAINKAKQCRVRVRRLNDRMYSTVSKTTHEHYTLCSTPDGWNCGCEGYGHTGCCKHLGALARRFAREGRGAIIVAPLAAPELAPMGEEAVALPVAPVEVEWGFRSDVFSNQFSRRSDIERFRAGRTTGALDAERGYRMRAANGVDRAYTAGYRIGYQTAQEEGAPADDPDSGIEHALELANDRWASRQDPRGF